MTETRSSASRPADEAEAEFDLLARRAGIAVPEERRAGAIAAYIDVMRTARLLHTARAPGQWSAQNYLVDTITAAKDEQ